MKRKLITTIISFAAALALAACGSGSAPSASGTQGEATAAEGSTSGAAAAAPDAGASAGMQGGGDFVYGIATEIDNFDPFTATTADAKSVYFNIYEGLVKVSPDGTFKGAVASDYKISDDAKTYTFTLRDGVKFHNGQEVTADDVIYSLQHAKDSKMTGFDNVEDISSKDGKTITVTLKTGDTDFLADASSPIVPRDSDNNGELAKKPVGTGPFMLTDYAVQDHATLEKFKDYWGTPAHLDKVTVKFIASSSDLLMNFQSGAIQGFMADTSITQQLPADSAVVNVSNSNAIQALYLNNAAKPFDDVRVRQAVNYAVDADGVIDTVDYGVGTKLGSAMIPNLKAYYDDSLADVYNVNVEKAKELLAEAGLADGFSFTVKVPSNYQVHLDTAQVLVNQLAAAGIQMNIEQVDWATWLENVYTNRDYEATIISVDGAIASPTAFLSRYQSDADNNFVNFKSDQFDKAYAKAIADVDESAREKDFKECQKILSDEAASAYIQDIAYNLAYTKDFTGFVQYPLYATDFSAIARTAK